MADENQKWVVHIVGPDDVIEQPDYLTALRRANSLNAEFEKARRGNANDPNWPYCIAIAREANDPEVRVTTYSGAGRVKDSDQDLGEIKIKPQS